MARINRKPEPPVSNSLVASAARISGTGVNNLSRPTRADGWQADAWKYYHTIGEFRYACDWVGSMLSKALIFATEETADGVKPVAQGNILEYISNLFGDADGRAEMFRLIGIHMSVTGECWIVGYENPDRFGDGGDIWQVVAANRCIRPTSPNGKWKVNDKWIDAPQEQVLAIRIWRPNPLDPDIAISPAQAVLSILGEIARLTDHVAAQVDSRLAGAGILLMPSEMTFPPPPQAEGATPVVANNAEDLMKVITEAMATSITNRSDASALVPIVITAPGEVIDKIQHLTFWSDLDKQAIDLRNEAIRRLALGMDMPPEVLQGLSDSNHWSAWQADESAIKAHTEPLLKIITTALAQGYLRPLLAADDSYKSQKLSRYSIRADTSEMRLRPNRSKEALELYNLGELSGAALLRETGFDPDDAMDEKERALWLTRKVASGSTTPELVEAALRELGVDLTVIREVVQGEIVPTEARPAPSLREHPVQDIPDQQRSISRKQAREDGNVPSADPQNRASLIAAAEQLAIRALERAGNRLKGGMKGFKSAIPAVALHTVIVPENPDDLLTDAWGHVPPVAERYGVDTEVFTGHLDGYCRSLLLTQKPHSFEYFSRYMVAALSEGEAA
jgi:hypothetical protein